jgi:hypothetical protein
MAVVSFATRQKVCQLDLFTSFVRNSSKPPDHNSEDEEATQKQALPLPNFQTQERQLRHHPSSSNKETSLMAHLNDTTTTDTFVYASDQTGSPSPCGETFNDDPLGYLAETLLATEEAWGQLPGLIPLFLREVLEKLLEVVS